jgi:hypothetical protein
METKRGYMGTTMKKDGEKEEKTVTAREVRGEGTHGSLHGDICAEQE